MGLRAALSAVQALVRRLDRLTTCSLCGNIIDGDKGKVTCSCASLAVYKRVGRCNPVVYCAYCFSTLRTEDGRPIPEMSRDSCELR